VTAAALRLGIVGCGKVVERGHLPALSGMKDFRLTAVADPVLVRPGLVAGVPGYPGLADMLESERLDAVLVCTPPELHLEHAQACAAAGIQALVEKPPGGNAEDARTLAALRPEPAIGFNRRFARGMPIGRRSLDRPMRVTAMFDAPPGDWDRGEGTPAALLDLGCHVVDLACWLTGAQPARARALAISAARATFEVEMAGGLRLYAGCGVADAYRELIDLRAEDGETRSWIWPEAALRRATARLVRRPQPLVESWRAQLRAFAGLVRREHPGRLALASEGIQVMAALDAVDASASQGGGWVRIPLGPAPSGAPAG